MAQEPSKGMLWGGRVLSAGPSLLLLGSAVGKLAHAAPVVENFTKKFGYPESAIAPIGVLEILCVVLYLVPQTAVLGAVVLTGYLGGAVATHLRVEDYGTIPVVVLLGVFVWGGIFLRDERLRALLPLRKPA